MNFPKMELQNMDLKDAYQLLDSTFGDANWKKSFSSFNCMCLSHCESLTNRSEFELEELFIKLRSAWQTVYFHETSYTSTSDSDDTDFSADDENSSTACGSNNCASFGKMASVVNTELMLQQMNKMMVDLVKKNELANATADELINEEVRLKIKQEKRREKKKRQKEKLKMQKKEATSNAKENECTATNESFVSLKLGSPKGATSKLKTKKLDGKKSDVDSSCSSKKEIIDENYGEMESDIDLDFIIAKKGIHLKNKVDRKVNFSTKLLEKELREKSPDAQSNSKLRILSAEESKIISGQKGLNKETIKLKIDKANRIVNNDGDGSSIRPGKVHESEIHGSDGNNVLNSAALGYTYGRQGNFRAEIGEFECAIECYTKAIKILPSDSKLYGNRACCYEKLGEYDKALEDANKAIERDPSLYMNYFRKGLALSGLKNYREAEIAFKIVLRIDPQCCFPIRELLLLRKAELMDMGFSENQAYTAACAYKTVQEATNGILENRIPKDPYDLIYISDDDEDHGIVPNVSTFKEKINEVPLNTKNSKQSNVALWVGNIVTTTEKSELHSLFSKYGEIFGIFVLREKTRDDCHCAFVDYREPSSVDKAIAGLNGFNLHGKNLIVRRPTIKTPEGAVQKAKVGKQDPSKNIEPVKDITKLKLFSSNTDCSYWKALGYCRNGVQCNFKHVPEHRLIDRK